VSDEDEVRGADAFHERAAGERIEHALLEVVRLAVLDAKDGHFRAGEEKRKPRVEAVRRAFDTPHGASDADDRRRAAFDRVEDTLNLAARRFEEYAERSRVVDRLCADAQKLQFEVLLWSLLWFVPHVARHRITIR